jgi:hypothetical protein
LKQNKKFDVKQKKESVFRSSAQKGSETDPFSLHFASKQIFWGNRLKLITTRSQPTWTEISICSFPTSDFLPLKEQRKLLKQQGQKRGR